MKFLIKTLGWERFRAAQFGIVHHATIALNPKEANDPRCIGVLDVLPRYLAKDGVVAVGEVGFDSMTVEEEKAFVRQLELAVEFELPAMVHTPHRDKEQVTRRTLELVAESGLAPGMVVVDHLNEVTVDQVDEAGCWMGFSIYPDTKMDEHRMAALVKKYGHDRILVNSAADWGISDPLKVPKTIAVMRAHGIADEVIERIVWDNPVAFFGQTGRLDVSDIPDEPAIDRQLRFENNSVLRGERPDA